MYLCNYDNLEWLKRATHENYPTSQMLKTEACQICQKSPTEVSPTSLISPTEKYPTPKINLWENCPIWKLLLKWSWHPCLSLIFHLLPRMQETAGPTEIFQISGKRAFSVKDIKLELLKISGQSKILPLIWKINQESSLEVFNGNRPT